MSRRIRSVVQIRCIGINTHCYSQTHNSSYALDLMSISIFLYNPRHSGTAIDGISRQIYWRWFTSAPITRPFQVDYQDTTRLWPIASIKRPSGLLVRWLLTFDLVESSVSFVLAVSPTNNLNSLHKSVNRLVNTLCLAYFKHIHVLRLELLF